MSEEIYFEPCRLSAEESLCLTDRNETPEMGCIGHLRGDFGGGGKAFHSRWSDHLCADRNDELFKAVFGKLIDTLREKDNLLSCRTALYNNCILNSFDAGAMTKITVCNRRQSQSRFEKQNLLPLRGDRLDRYRDEYNRMLTENAEQSSGITQEKYLTVTVQKPNYSEAKSYFNRVESEFAALFLSLGSRLEPLDAAEKLRVLFDFYHYGAEDDFLYEPERYGRRGYTFKDAIAPDSMEFRSDYFKIDGRYGRVLYLRDYANFIKDSFLAELTDIDRGLMFSIDCNPIPTDEAIRQGEGKLLAVETNISNWQRKQNRNQNFSADVPYDMEKQRAESREFLDDLVSRDQRMIPSLMTLCHTAESKEQLDADTESIRQCARKHLCSMNVLRWQQLEGLNTVLPYGVPKLSIRRTLTTEALAVFLPFRVQEICHRNGIYFANNAISKNLMTVNRAELQNGNAFICGVSGSGKSLLAKQEAISLYLSDPNADILIIDPEREYGKICDALGGETITVSAASPHHINALDMSRSYGDESNPVTLKSEFLCSLCEEAAGKLTAGQKSVIDRCTASVYREYLYSGCTGKVPTLKDFYEVLKAQPEPEAQSVALSMELFINGTLNTFAKETNVDTQNRFLCYDIHDLGKTLMPIGMLVVLDSILNRITANRENGRKTYVFLDEIYLLFRHAYAANFLFTLWKRARKYGAFITGITQNVEDLLQSHTARTMLANSELVVMLNQAATDRAELAALMGISDAQMSYITNAEAGHGLVKIGGALVPFVNRMKKGTELYRLCTTKPGE